MPKRWEKKLWRNEQRKSKTSNNWTHEKRVINITDNSMLRFRSISLKSIVPATTFYPLKTNSKYLQYRILLPYQGMQISQYITHFGTFLLNWQFFVFSQVHYSGCVVSWPFKNRISCAPTYSTMNAQFP